MYYVIGTYQGTTETVDEFDDKVEAVLALREYRMAFGPQWALKLSKVEVEA